MLAGYATSVIATVLTLILGSIIIALAWLGARPMLSLVIIAMGVGAAFVLGKFGKKSIPVPPTGTLDEDNTHSTPPPRNTTTPPPRK
jgi:hypothetical protein